MSEPAPAPKLAEAVSGVLRREYARCVACGEGCPEFGLCGIAGCRTG